MRQVLASAFLFFLTTSAMGQNRPASVSGYAGEVLQYLPSPTGPTIPPSSVQAPGIRIAVTTAAGSGPGSFFKQLDSANRDAGVDTIVFAIPGPGPHVIPVAPNWPPITHPVVIDGTTQEGYDGLPVIELNGGGLPVTSSGVFQIGASGGGSTIRGLSIYNSAGIGILITGSANNVVEGCIIGTNRNGRFDFPNIRDGIQIYNGSNNRIGGRGRLARNIVSWNEGHGIRIAYLSDNNVVQGNLVGLDPTGQVPYPNAFSGITVQASSNFNLVGDSTAAGRNVVTGNDSDGVSVFGFVSGFNPGTGNRIIGNFIGTDTLGSGNFVVSNGRGVYIASDISTLVGGPDPKFRNIISGNLTDGILVHGSAMGGTGLTIQGNFIGTDVTGTVALPNKRHGIQIAPTSGATFRPGALIGGSVPGAGNIIGGNKGSGIRLSGATVSGTTILRNEIGVTSSGAPIANTDDGIDIRHAAGTIIGRGSTADANVISANGGYGIRIQGSGATETRVQRNFIGTDRTGQLSVGNTFHGVFVDSANGAMIGGLAPDSGNVIARNGAAGVFVNNGRRISVRQNSIYSNSGLGIDLAPSGANSNDLLDLDNGPNDLQNTPVIDSIRTVGAAKILYGSLNSEPLVTFAIEAFALEEGKKDDPGQGKLPVGSATCVTDIAGNGNFSIPLPTLIPNLRVTLTATDGVGNTSEFSRSIRPITLTYPKGDTIQVSATLDSITWIANGVDLVDILFSETGGEAGPYTIVELSLEAGTGVYRWTVPEHVSRKCRVIVRNSAVPSEADTSGFFRVKPYDYTRVVNGQYDQFGPSMNGWSFINDKNPMWLNTWWNNFNYRTNDYLTNLPWPQVVIQKQYLKNVWPDWFTWVKTFGVDSCYFDWGKSTVRIRTAMAARWTETVTKDFEGVCAGFSVSAIRGFEDKTALPARFFGEIPPFVSISELTPTDPVRTVIHQLQIVTEATSIPGKEDFAAYTPTQTLIQLMRRFREERSDNGLLFIRAQDPGGTYGAHAVVPYSIRRQPSGLYRINVYDPNQNVLVRYVEVDSAYNNGSGKWTFSPFSWSAEKDLYLYPPASSFFSPLYKVNYGVSPELPSPPTDGSRPGQVTAGVDDPTSIQVAATRSADIRISDAQGRWIGHQSGRTTLDSIPGSRVTIPITSQFTVPSRYSLPGGEYSVTLDSFGDSTSSLWLESGGLIYNSFRSGAAPAEHDRYRIAGGLALANPDPRPKQFEMTLVGTIDSSEQIVSLGVLTLESNDSIQVTPLPGTGGPLHTFRVRNLGGAVSYRLEVETAGSGGRYGAFRSGILSVNPITTYEVHPDWGNLLGGPMLVLVDRGNDGTTDDTLRIANQVLSVGSGAGEGIPTQFELAQNFPNPFNPTTIIEYSVPTSTPVRIAVYNLLGELVAILIDEQKEAGRHRSMWDGRTSAGTPVASGLYLYRIEAGEFRAVRKMLLVR